MAHEYRLRDLSDLTHWIEILKDTSYEWGMGHDLSIIQDNNNHKIFRDYFNGLIQKRLNSMPTQGFFSTKPLIWE